MRATIFVTALTSIAALASASPADKRGAMVTIGFSDSNGKSFSQQFTNNGKQIEITNPMAVKVIKNPSGAACTFKGEYGNYIPIIKGDNTLNEAEKLVSGTCGSG